MLQTETTRAMRERLLAYLLGQLGSAERQAVEREIAENVAFQRELEGMRACLEDAGITGVDKPKEPPPVGLAERTCQHVAVSAWSAGSFAPTASSVAGRWRLADAIVAIGVALATVSLLLPAMQQSRHVARRTACQNNLRHLGCGLLEFAQLQNGRIPAVPARGKDSAGGIYSVELADAEVIDRDDLAEEIVCPSSQLAFQLRQGMIVVRIPTHAELLAAEGRCLDRLRRVMGGSYAYRIGYIHGNRYCTVRIRQTGRVPLMADAPSLHLADFQSANHAGCGQNVLFDDGRVRFLAHCSAPDRRDQLFKNHNGLRAAGCDATDTVLLASPFSPAIEMVLGGD